jgi:hypothetical protein
MRSDHLACAHCGGIVSEGNCAVCRITRAELARQRFTIPPVLIALVVALLTLMVAYVARHAV